MQLSCSANGDSIIKLCVDSNCTLCGTTTVKNEQCLLIPTLGGNSTLVSCRKNYEYPITNFRIIAQAPVVYDLLRQYRTSDCSGPSFDITAAKNSKCTPVPCSYSPFDRKNLEHKLLLTQRTEVYSTTTCEIDFPVSPSEEFVILERKQKYKI